MFAAGCWVVAVPKISQWDYWDHDMNCDNYDVTVTVSEVSLASQSLLYHQTPLFSSQITLRYVYDDFGKVTFMRFWRCIVILR